MPLWTRRRDRPRKPGFTRFLPYSDRLYPIWDELATLAETEERRLEVVLNGKGAYVLIGNLENGVEVMKVCAKHGASSLCIRDEHRGALRDAYDRHASVVRHVLHMEYRPVLMTASAKLGVALGELCES